MAVCPFIGKCKQKVTIDFYSNVCTNVTEDKYKECPFFKQLTAEPKTPEEWRRLILGA
jgi:hypothetical protein